MRRHLLFVGIIGALLSQGWGGALAAVLCPHAGMSAAAAVAERDAHALSDGEEMPACCRKTQADSEGDHCPMSGGMTDEAPDEGLIQNSTRPDSALAESSGPESPHDSAGAAGGGAVGHLPTACLHCVGRPQPPPASPAAREPNGTKRDGN
ncbi:MAG: hypothetical protein ACRD68_12055, partial [Pyrinomonadaceae bacterium]